MKMMTLQEEINEYLGKNPGVKNKDLYEKFEAKTEAMKGNLRKAKSRYFDKIKKSEAPKIEIEAKKDASKIDYDKMPGEVVSYILKKPYPANSTDSWRYFHEQITGATKRGQPPEIISSLIYHLIKLRKIEMEKIRLKELEKLK